MGEECERCADPCEVLPVVEVVTALSVLYTDRARLTPEESQALADAVLLLRVHAVPPSHPWAVK
jgi:hypothetical protein